LLALYCWQTGGAPLLLVELVLLDEDELVDDDEVEELLLDDEEVEPLLDDEEDDELVDDDELLDEEPEGPRPKKRPE